LTKKQCCAILWEICGDFHRDTEKQFDYKTTLTKAIETFPHFKDTALLKLDSLTPDMMK